MDVTRPTISGLLVVLALIAVPGCSSGETAATGVTLPVIQEPQVCGSGQAQATSVTPPATQEAQAADLFAGYALPIPTEELGLVSGGALTLITPAQLQQSAAGVKLWDEALMKPTGTVESGPGQILTSVSVQQSQFH